VIAIESFNAGKMMKRSSIMEERKRACGGAAL
jgi:hypothetical protein